MSMPLTVDPAGQKKERQPRAAVGALEKTEIEI